MEGYRFERFYLAPSPSPRASIRSLPRAAWELQIEARKHDLIHVEGEVAGAICLPSLASRPSLVTLNGLHLLRRVKGMGRAAACANLRLIVRAASRTICVSESERDDLLEATGGRGADRVVLIHNGVDPAPVASGEERAAARAALGLPAGAVVGAWVAGLDGHKDPLTAARAAIDVARSGLPMVLLIAGDGPLRPELERTANASGVDGLRILGHRRDVRQVLAAADFFALASQREGLSFALLEAMSMGLVPVVSDGPGNPDAVGDAGVVVPRGDVTAFADALRQLIGDEQARVTLGARARERVIERFSADEMARRTHDVYDAVLREHGRALR
jgi:glycosyltransferase involved in cell wall biosynthesis